MTIKGHFVSSENAKVFLTQFGGFTDQTILFLPPFGEEMNLSRAILSKQFKRLSSEGNCVVSLDYRGTGDSEGEFESYSPDDWVKDILNAGKWLQENGVKSIVLWTLRVGSLIVLANQKKLHDELPITGQIHWKPVTNGKQFANQFLRIKQAKTMQQETEKVDWRAKVLSGEFVEVAGYVFSRAMLEGLDAMKISPEDQPLSAMVWVELGAGKMTPAVNKFVEPWASVPCHYLECKTPAFWQIPEIFDIPELDDITRQQLLRLEGQ